MLKNKIVNLPILCIEKYTIKEHILDTSAGKQLSQAATDV